MDTQILPIDSVLPDISEQLESHVRLVLSAPPGAGKTTKVPLHLLNAAWLDGQKIIMLEPRRIAARRAAERMADMLGEKVGETVGLRSRLDTRIGPKTRIEVVTEGVFTNFIAREPDLPGVGLVLFDEFHERSLDADLGLTLALETQNALRDDLRIVIMSATLDTAKIIKALDAPLVESDGRAFPVVTTYLGRSEDRLEDQMARAIRKALTEETGSILAFLPGAAEIHRTAERLEGLPDNILICQLYGALPPKVQDEAIRAAPAGQRKIVLSTDIAESSLTIEGVRIVVDSGLARVPVWSTGSLGSTLQTVKAAIANVDQRQGRAGRTEEGVCYRLWHEEENRGLPRSPEPEILSADLSSMLLRLADWGDSNPFALTWLDPPPKGQVEAARSGLKGMGLLDEKGVLTDQGRKAVHLPLHPRLAQIILAAENENERVEGAYLAALLSETGIGGRSLDLGERLGVFLNNRSSRVEALKKQARKWAGSHAEPDGDLAALLARAWPDRIARARPNDPKRFQLASGGGVRLPENAQFEGKTWLVVAETGGQYSGEPIIRAAYVIPETQARRVLKKSIREYADFDPAVGTIKARLQKCLGEIVLSETPLQKPDNNVIADAVVRHLTRTGLSALPVYEAISNLLTRIQLARGHSKSDDWPDLSISALQNTMPEWLTPALEADGLEALGKRHIISAIRSWIGWLKMQEVDRLTPEIWETPLGRRVAIDYSGEQGPVVSIRVQELYGLRMHPSICDGRMPVTLSLLSPAQRQIAITKDLPGFWSGGYGDMRKDMKGRYPKHDWPEDPANAAPLKPRPRK